MSLFCGALLHISQNPYFTGTLVLNERGHMVKITDWDWLLAQRVEHKFASEISVDLWVEYAQSKIRSFDC